MEIYILFLEFLKRKRFKNKCTLTRDNPNDQSHIHTSSLNQNSGRRDEDSWTNDTADDNSHTFQINNGNFENMYTVIYSF